MSSDKILWKQFLNLKFGQFHLKKLRCVVVVIVVFSIKKNNYKISYFGCQLNTDFETKNHNFPRFRRIH